MGGGILLGAIWGAIVAGVVLVVVSLSTPLPQRPGPGPVTEIAVVTPPAEEVDAAAPEAEAEAAGDTPVSETVPEDDPAPEAAPEAPADVAVPSETAETDAPVTDPAPVDEDVVAETDALVVAPADPPAEEIVEAPAPDAPAVDTTPPDAPAGSAATAPDAAAPDAPRTDPAPQPARLPERPANPEAAPQAAAPPTDLAAAPEPIIADVPAPPAAVAETESGIAANLDAAPDTPATAPGAPRDGTDLTVPEVGATDAAASPPPAPTFIRPDSGSRLPQVTTDAAMAGSDTELAGEAAPMISGALADFATPFPADEPRPLIAVVLIDTPDTPLDLETLTRFSFPVAFAIDPARPDAAARAAAFRAAGFEVLIMGSVIPEGATASDTEVALAAAAEILPEAIAILDTAGSRIQGDRPVLDATVAAIAERGQGIVAFPRGLNAAEQTARREDVPAATLFRQLDDEGQRATVIARFLSRAEFAAIQEGTVVVAGLTRPDTVTALFSWALGNRNAGVALAPLSAVLLRNAAGDP